MLCYFGINDTNALEIVEKALAALGPFSAISRALLLLIPQNIKVPHSIPHFDKQLWKKARNLSKIGKVADCPMTIFDHIRIKVALIKNKTQDDIFGKK